MFHRNQGREEKGSGVGGGGGGGEEGGGARGRRGRERGKMSERE